MRLPRIVPAAAAAAALCLALAACGGDDAPVASASASGSGSGSGSGSSEIALPSANPTASLSPQEAQAISSYKTYLRAQIDDSIAKTKEFVAAVKEGNVEKAKGLYAPSRVGWESIEPIAGALGDVDPAVDLREADLEEGDTWTGWHVIEKALWENNTTTDMGPVGDQLIKDLETLPPLFDTIELDVDTMATGAKELMDEIASGKITGEEEAFSHTDFWDFKANLDGAKKVFELLTPIAQPIDSALISKLTTEFADVEKALEQYREGDGWVSYDKVTEDQRKQLTDVVNALAEPLSTLGGVIAGGASGTATAGATPSTSASPSATP
ncbi:MAG: iron uptake system protein EfeO [Sporichthyaceae bacterium]